MWGSIRAGDVVLQFKPVTIRLPGEDFMSFVSRTWCGLAYRTKLMPVGWATASSLPVFGTLQPLRLRRAALAYHDPRFVSCERLHDMLSAVQW